jgi:RHS repeat-associated protein
LTYDQENRLTGYGSATYTYDGDGLRMSKNAGTSEAFSWDVSGGLPLMIVDGSQSFVYGPGGLPLEQVSGTAATWLHHDQIGSTRLLTDASGSVLATYTFDPYGNLTGSTGSSTTAIRFAGQYWDSESAMYYLRARYYEPSTGQFQPEGSGRFEDTRALCIHGGLAAEWRGPVGPVWNNLVVTVTGVVHDRKRVTRPRRKPGCGTVGSRSDHGW